MLTILATRAEQLLTGVTADDLPKLLGDPDVHLWVDLSAVADEVTSHILFDVFGFHQLAVHDAFAAHEHPKVETFDGYLYLTTHGMTQGATAEEPEIVELDVFLGKRFLVTYHEKHSRSVAALKEIVTRGGEPLRRGPARLLHAILDRQADGIEPVLDSIEERIEIIENRAFERPRDDDLAELLSLRRSVLHLRRWISKQREVMLRMARSEFALVPPQDALLFRDVYDHLQRFSDYLENYRELATSVQDAYLSLANNRLGEIMKFLTVFTAALMPLTVITGIYGMNFDHMPELRESWGYPVTLGIMALTAGSVLLFFWRRGWLGVKEGGLPPPPPAARATRRRTATRDVV